MFLYLVVPNPTVTISPSSSIQGAMVGSPQAIQCIVSTVSGVELSSVMISWMGPDGNVISDSNRIIINTVTTLGNNFTSTLNFIYLMEGDEGIYTCNVMILETTEVIMVQLSNFTCKYNLSLYVTGFWKTDQIITLGLFHFLAQLMATLVHYTYTVPSPGLVDWSAFLE